MKHNYAEYVPIFKALADETRLKIVDMLSCGEMCACDILEFFNITQPTLSYHMKILTDCNIVNARKEGSWMKYSLNLLKFETFEKFVNDISKNTDDCICKNYCKNIKKCSDDSECK
ncbi:MULTISPECIES: ArsR/SmtB family transcription factor [Clostridium]|uniref:Transcriptional regulator n=1 Tax=Clostridium kluyveri TaxID=1534 RepID=A0A1L5F7G3_CLOKL|nr:metalloregulator ArsR/SmtB family transcription factor [Clostridium kluyveri]APM38945.1 transcriptional regulator [Clostridium kluyveri]UZQ51268.1 metalloregulator ArsR/SmtB family transcription factor [Clostridium kluyveri]